MDGWVDGWIDRLECQTYTRTHVTTAEVQQAPDNSALSAHVSLQLLLVRKMTLVKLLFSVSVRRLVFLFIQSLFRFFHSFIFVSFLWFNLVYCFISLV